MLEVRVALLSFEPEGDVGWWRATPTHGVEGRDERIEVLAIKGVEVFVRSATDEITHSVEFAVAELFDELAVGGDDEVSSCHEHRCSALRAPEERALLREDPYRPRVEGAGRSTLLLERLSSSRLANLVLL